MRPYLVYTWQDYVPNSAGSKALHRLCHELNEAGQEAYVGAGWATNPEWNTPTHPVPLPGDWIAVYPEVIRGNPWNAPHVARWVLYYPGALGGDKTYAPAEMVFSWHPVYIDAPLLNLPTVELDIYADRHLEREGAVYYIGKSPKTREMPGMTEITNEMRIDRHALALALNRATALYTFDNVTGMGDVARLCGCPVVIIPDGEHSPDGLVGDGIGWDEIPPPFDIAAFRARYVGLMDTFRDQLADFIRITQA